MEDFSIFGTLFDTCLHNLNVVLKRCKNTRLVLNWEKCQFMVKECIFLGHMLSHVSTKVDLAKVEVIANLPLPNCVRVVRSLFGHARFSMRFVKDSSK